MDPFIVGVAPTGARRKTAEHPNLPVTVPEIVRAAAASVEAGASFVHLHIRDADEGHVLDADAYRDLLTQVRAAVGPDPVLQVTTEAVGRYGPEAQMALVRDLRPEAVSLAVRELVPGAADVPTFAAFVDWMAAERIAPQYLLYDRSDIAALGRLIASGIVPAAPCALIALGAYGDRRSGRPQELVPILDAPVGSWFAVCFGPGEIPTMLAAAAFGGHARVGFENSIQMPDGRLAEDNAEIVAATAAIAPLAGRPLADGAAARALMGVHRC